MNIINKNNASNFLFINAFLWGSSYVWAKMLLSFLPQFSILMLSSLGSLIATIVIFHSHINNICKEDVLPSLKISIFSIISNTFFMFALKYTSSSNTAFIVQLSVIITPILMAIYDKKLPQGKIILSSIIAIVGLFLLMCDFKTFRLNLGDMLALGNALFFSIYLLSLNKNVGKVNPINYTLIQHTINTLFFMVIAVSFEFHKINIQKLSSPILIALVAANVFVSIVTILVQSTAIKYVRPDMATLIYTFEPLTAMILGFIFMGERLRGIVSIVGCILILLSVFTNLYTIKIKIQIIKAVSNPIIE